MIKCGYQKLTKYFKELRKKHPTSILISLIEHVSITIRVTVVPSFFSELPLSNTIHPADIMYFLFYLTYDMFDHTKTYLGYKH